MITMTMLETITMTTMMMLTIMMMTSFFLSSTKIINIGQLKNIRKQHSGVISQELMLQSDRKQS